MDAGEYCRAVEAYLCRKNDGHLIRIVGPAFEMVCAWAEAGIPLSVVRRGIDQRYARYYGRGPRRHPVRVEFCEADVLTLFDGWKRAVHVAGADAEEGGAPPDLAARGFHSEAGDRARRRRRSLSAHLDCLGSALADWSPLSGQPAPALDQAIARARMVVGEARPTAGALRGAVRRNLIERLAALDQGLAEAARHDADGETMTRLRREAADSLAPFRERMRPNAFAAALDTATDHLLAGHWRLPRLTYE